PVSLKKRKHEIGRTEVI
ncbi:hypothetical protein OpiT1DRAFT_00596, partial [Opitutaceae bacterium TAV1]